MPTPAAPASGESYHVQHSPFGAFASFTIGLVDAPGGFGQSLRGPAKQNVYVGFRHGPANRWQLLPFLTPPQSQEGSFTGDTTVVAPPRGFDALRPADYQRTLALASDTWRADETRFGFSLLSPFGEVPDPAKMKKAAARFHLREHQDRAATSDDVQLAAAHPLVDGQHAVAARRQVIRGRTLGPCAQPLPSCCHVPTTHPPEPAPSARPPSGMRRHASSERGHLGTVTEALGG